MNIEIFSMMAALVGNDCMMWRGNVSDKQLGLGPVIVTGGEKADAEINERIFRFFNRVDSLDEEKLEAVGYRLPSLSVGDIVTWGGKAFRVEGHGFSCITRNGDEAVRHVEAMWAR